jgi:hypothetical protein
MLIITRILLGSFILHTIIMRQSSVAIYLREKEAVQIKMNSSSLASVDIHINVSSHEPPLGDLDCSIFKSICPPDTLYCCESSSIWCCSQDEECGTRPYTCRMIEETNSTHPTNHTSSPSPSPSPSNNTSSSSHRRKRRRRRRRRRRRNPRHNRHDHDKMI